LFTHDINHMDCHKPYQPYPIPIVCYKPYNTDEQAYAQRLAGLQSARSAQRDKHNRTHLPLFHL